MLQSPSSEADWFAATREIPRISRNRTHKCPPPVSTLGQPNNSLSLQSINAFVHDVLCMEFIMAVNSKSRQTIQ
jgi:hypothetical protein